MKRRTIATALTVVMAGLAQVYLLIQEPDHGLVCAVLAMAFAVLALGGED